MPPQGCSTPTEQPIQPQFGLSLGLGSLMSPALGDSPQQGMVALGTDFFLTCLGLCCWGLSGSSLGLLGTESKRVRACSPPQPPGGGVCV